MNEFIKFPTDFWISPMGKKIKSLGPIAYLISLHLMTSHHTKMLGIYNVHFGAISHDTGISEEETKKGVESLCGIGFCHYDEASEYVWVYEMVKSRIADRLKPNDNLVKNVQCHYNALPNLPFLNDFYQKYHAAST